LWPNKFVQASFWTAFKRHRHLVDGVFFAFNGPNESLEPESIGVYLINGVQYGHWFYVESNFHRPAVFHDKGNVARFDFVSTHKRTVFTLLVINALSIAFYIHTAHLAAFKISSDVLAFDLAKVHAVFCLYQKSFSIHL